MGSCVNIMLLDMAEVMFFSPVFVSLTVSKITPKNYGEFFLMKFEHLVERGSENSCLILEVMQNIFWIAARHELLDST